MKFLEVHNGLSALLVEKSKYDGMWVSSLTHAASNGLPDNELVPLQDRANLVREIRGITTKPILVDVDTLGGIEHVPFFVKLFRDAGAWGIVIEDKKYPKQNSLLEENSHQLEDVDTFCQKIKAAKAAAGGMRVIARLESLIAKHSMADALIRAQAYEEAGADMILIHSKQKIEATEVMEFARRFEDISDRAMVAIPTTYVLPENHPFSVVIHANHMLRASMRAMQKVANEEVTDLSSVQDIFDLCGH